MSDGLALPPLNLPDPRSRYAVILLLDRSYLTPLRVLLHSLQNAVRNRTCDIVVLTNDGEVAGDSFVKARADRIICLSDEDIAAVASVRRDAVEKHYRHKSVGKYTFLKLLAYDDLGYRGHLFLDCDMVCLDPDFRFEHLFSESCDLAAAPIIAHGRLGIEKRGAARATSYTAKEQKRSEAAFIGMLSYRSKTLSMVNSGVFFAGHRLLRRATVEHMLELARKEAFDLEQRISSTVLSKTKGLRYKALSCGYNAPALPLYAMGEERFERVRDQITFLHYNRNKPWHRSRSEADWLERIWWQALDDANSPDQAPSIHTSRSGRRLAPAQLRRWWWRLRSLPQILTRLRRKVSMVLSAR